MHLTYIWAELKKLGMNTDLWFNLLARDRNAPPKVEEKKADENVRTQLFIIMKKNMMMEKRRC